MGVIPFGATLIPQLDLGGNVKDKHKSGKQCRGPDSEPGHPAPLPATWFHSPLLGAVRKMGERHEQTIHKALKHQTVSKLIHRGEMQFKATLMDHFLPIRLTKIKIQHILLVNCGKQMLSCNSAFTFMQISTSLAGKCGNTQQSYVCTYLSVQQSHFSESVLKTHLRHVK